jgi:uncharacterized protein with HEPN domain
MNRKQNDVYLNHIIDAANQIEKYLKGFSYRKFIKNQLRIDAVIREFEIIGEAVSKINSQFKKKHKMVEWKLAKAMRNKLIHEYFEIDLKVIWQTSKKDIPKFKKQIEKILKELSK